MDGVGIIRLKTGTSVQPDTSETAPIAPLKPARRKPDRPKKTTEAPPLAAEPVVVFEERIPDYPLDVLFPGLDVSKLTPAQKKRLFG